MWGDFIDNENNMFFCLKFLVLTHILYNSHRRDSTDEHLLDDLVNEENPQGK